MLSPRDNYLAAVYGEKQDYVPLGFVDILYGGVAAANATEMPYHDGEDIFGVPWIMGKEGSMHKPGFVMFDDITEWDKHVKMPDLSHIDFRKLAEKELAEAQFNRKEKALTVMDGGGAFMRLIALMGVENGLIALATEPDACMDFFDAYTSYKIEYINKVIEAYKPDVYVQGEDIATEKSLFFAPELYRKLLKPFHARIGEAVRARGIPFGVHCCGKCEELLPDYMEIGATLWQSAQTMNDLPGVLDTYRGKLAIEGGWSGSSEATYLGPDDSGDGLRSEVRKTMSELKKPGFILWAFPFIFNDSGNLFNSGDPRANDLIDEFEKLKWF